VYSKIDGGLMTMVMARFGRSLRLLLPVSALLVALGVYTPAAAQGDPLAALGGGATTTGPLHFATYYLGGLGNGFSSADYVNSAIGCARDGAACGGFVSAVLAAGNFHFYSSNVNNADFQAISCSPQCEEGYAENNGTGTLSGLNGNTINGQTSVRATYHIEYTDGGTDGTGGAKPLISVLTEDYVTLFVCPTALPCDMETFQSINGQIEVNAQTTDDPYRVPWI
jgi:hypothetical protein